MAANFVKTLSRSYFCSVKFSFFCWGVFHETERVSSTIVVSIDVVGNQRSQRQRECVLRCVLRTPWKQSIWWYTVEKTPFYLCIPHYKTLFISYRLINFSVGSEACWVNSEFWKLSASRWLCSLMGVLLLSRHYVDKVRSMFIQLSASCQI